MKEYYHVFYSADYKGGELYCSVNLSKEEAIKAVYQDYIERIADEYDEADYPKNATELMKLIEGYDAGEEVYSTYAGYAGCTFPEVFMTDSTGKLVTAGFDKTEIYNLFFKS